MFQECHDFFGRTHYADMSRSREVIRALEAETIQRGQKVNARFFRAARIERTVADHQGMFTLRAEFPQTFQHHVRFFSAAFRIVAANDMDEAIQPENAADFFRRVLFLVGRYGMPDAHGCALFQHGEQAVVDARPADAFRGVVSAVDVRGTGDERSAEAGDR